MAQSVMFDDLVKQSDCVVHAHVVQRGRKVRMEDGVLYCSVRCVIDETFKGNQKAGDTITVNYTEFGFIGLGGKFTPGGDTAELLPVGKAKVFLLRSVEESAFLPGPTYEPVDEVLGIQEATEHLLWHLRWMKK